MEEQKKEQSVTKEDVQPDMIKLAKEQADRLEKANKEMKDLLDRRDLIRAEQILGGKSEAGQQSKTEEDKEIEEARAMLMGTGFEDDLFPEK